jgi:hypothetical protein
MSVNIRLIIIEQKIDKNENNTYILILISDKYLFLNTHP